MKVITIAGTATKDGEVKEGGMDKAGLHQEYHFPLSV